MFSFNSQPLNFSPISIFTKTLISPFSPLFKLSPTLPFHVLRSTRLAGTFHWKRNGQRVASLNGWSSGIDKDASNSIKKRKIVEHIWLLKAKEGLSEEEENDMLDYLYTAQYQMGGVVAVSLGRIVDPNADGFTHAVFMRFQKKENLEKFYQVSSTGVLKEHVMPYCHGLISVDYESEVEDDILPIFRKGELLEQDFNYGVECILLISVIESALEEHVTDVLDTLTNLTVKFGSLIVQATQGSNINTNDKEYTHAMVMRFPSLEALKIFRESSEYSNLWNVKFKPITAKALEVWFAVDPVGTEIM